MRNVFRHPSAPVAVCAMTAILVFATDRAAFGSLIDVQFASDGQFPGYVWATGQPYTGAAIVGSAGDYWNPVLISFAEDETQQVPLLDSAQATTPAQLLVTHAGGWSDDNQAPVQPFANTPVAALMRQYAFSHTTGLFQVTNLTPGTYDLYLYSAGDHDGQTRVTDITVNGIQGSVGPNNSADSLVEGVNYLHFQPVVADDGLLTIFFNGTVADLTGTQGDINGFQLSYAPEPSAVCLLGLLPVAGLLKRRRARV